MDTFLLRPPRPTLPRGDQVISWAMEPSGSRPRRLLRNDCKGSHRFPHAAAGPWELFPFCRREEATQTCFWTGYGPARTKWRASIQSYGTLGMSRHTKQRGDLENKWKGILYLDNKINITKIVPWKIIPCYITDNYGTTGSVIKRRPTNKWQFRGGAAPRLLPSPRRGRAKGPALPCSGSSKRILQLQPRRKVLQETPSRGRRRMSSGDEVQRGTCHERHKGMLNIFPPSPWLFCSLSELDMSAPYLATAEEPQNQPRGRPLGKRWGRRRAAAQKKSRTSENKLNLIQGLK